MIDPQLHLLGLLYVGDASLTPLAGGLDQEITCPDEPLQGRLREGDIVDAFERYLGGCSSNHAPTGDETVGGEHEQRLAPPQQRNGSEEQESD